MRNKLHSRQKVSLALMLVLGLVLAHFSLLTTSVKAAGTNYYVDSVNGSDSNSGTSSGSPWRSLNPINNRSFGPGDVINLARGFTWTGSGALWSVALSINGAGAAGSPITVKAYGTGAAPIVRNPSTAGARVVIVNAPYTTIQGLLLRDTFDQGILFTADHGIAQGLEITHVGTGIQFNSSYNLATGNFIHDLSMVVNTPAPVGDDYGAQAFSVHNPNNEIAYNRMINCRAASYDFGTDGAGVEFYGNTDNTYVHHNYAYNAREFNEIGGGQDNNSLVAYNVIVNSGPMTGLHINNGAATPSQINNHRFINNTVIDSEGAYTLFYFDGTPTAAGNFIVRNNIFYVSKYTLAMQGSSNFTHDHNLYFATDGSLNVNYGLGAGERVANPLFVNAAGGDYHLQAGSPALNSGQAPTPYTSDMDGKAVPQGGAPDMGAYEYGGAAAVPVPQVIAGSFEPGLSPWRLQLQAPATGSVSRDSSTAAPGMGRYSARLTISTVASMHRYMMLRQDNFPVVSGRTYQVTFWAKASANRSLVTAVQGQNSPNTDCFRKQYTLTTAWQKYTYTFTASQTHTVSLQFNVGMEKPTVWLDGISMTLR